MNDSPRVLSLEYGRFGLQGWISAKIMELGWTFSSVEQRKRQVVIR